MYLKSIVHVVELHMAITGSTFTYVAVVFGGDVYLPISGNKIESQKE